MTASGSVLVSTTIRRREEPAISAATCNSDSDEGSEQTMISACLARPHTGRNPPASPPVILTASGEKSYPAR